MLGLPFSKTLRRDVLSELKRVLDYRPSHLSLYILTTGSNYIHREDLPDENWIEDEYLKVSNFLKERGFLHYEVSNFSLPGKESTHNLKYWDLESVAALGPSGTGFIKNGSEGFRYKWNVKGPTYTEEFLSEDQLLLEKIYLSLRTFKGINPCEVFTDEEIRESFLNLVEKWKGLGLLNSHESDHVSLSTKGFLLLDSFMDDIFSKKIIQ
jgi:oxygen-independent coproporphyrinogen-3 oxidase